jgi:uncharacterized repeat protein (TIGR03837 family)
MPHLSIDIFCRVVDNLGDIGVSWRLAKQLASEHGVSVRYIVDNLEVFQKFAPDCNLLELCGDTQELTKSGRINTSWICEGVSVLPWREDLLKLVYKDTVQVVLETFGGGLPEHVISLMLVKPTTWLDIQYLSAEDWVPRFHAIPSFHPSSNLERTLFFPGFSTTTGGLLRETKLLAQRDKFQGDVAAQNFWRAQLGLPDLNPDVIDASFFSYADASVDAFVEAVRNSPRPVRIFLTAGVDPILSQHLKDESYGLHVYQLPFLSQIDYDRLLWTCSINFVRGEDSWARAIWAGRPFLWHIYRQENNTHFRKLSAFLKVYTAQMGQNSGDSIEKLMFLWNEGESKNFTPFAALESWTEEARNFANQVANQTDLAARILEYVQQRQS